MKKQQQNAKYSTIDNTRTYVLWIRYIYSKIFHSVLCGPNSLIARCFQLFTKNSTFTKAAVAVAVAKHEIKQHSVKQHFVCFEERKNENGPKRFTPPAKSKTIESAWIVFLKVQKIKINKYLTNQKVVRFMTLTY